MNNFYTIYLDGIDKTGKDTLLPYIGPICNYKYICNVRGIMTQIAYSKLYNRPYTYDLKQQKNCLNVLLTVSEEDWKVRCKINNEPDISYEENQLAFEEAYEMLLKNNCPVIKINTSTHSPFQVAMIIVSEMNKFQDKYVFDQDSYNEARYNEFRQGE